MPSVIKPSIECWLLAGTVGLDAPLLLLQVARTGEHPAYWQPVTGGVEPGETAEQACRREVWEETGLVLEASSLVRLGHMLEVQVGQRLTLRKTLFVTATPNQQVQLSSEHSGWQWVPFNKAEELLYWPSNRETYTAVKQFLQG